MNGASSVPGLSVIADDLCTLTVPMRLLGVDLQRRVTLVRIDGELVVLSPAPLSDAQRAFVEQWGKVRWIIAPSGFHDTGVRESLRYWPEARLAISPALLPMLSDCSELLSLAECTLDRWNELLEPFFIAGMPRVQEHAFLHRPSGSLLIADLLFNIGQEVDFYSRCFYCLFSAVGKPAASRLFRSFIRERAAFEESLRVLARRDICRIVPSHGAVIENASGRILLEAWGVADSRS